MKQQAPRPTGQEKAAKYAAAGKINNRIATGSESPPRLT